MAKKEGLMLRLLIHAICVDRIVEPPQTTVARAIAYLEKCCWEIVLETFPGRDKETVRTLVANLVVEIAEELNKAADKEIWDEGDRSDDFVTTQQAAKMLGVSRPYVVRLIEEGFLEAYKVGPRRRILKSEVKRFRRDRFKLGEDNVNELTDLSSTVETCSKRAELKI
jgi:excisionase family DNA binding protein